MDISLDSAWLCKAALYIGVSATLVLGEVACINSALAEEITEKNGLSTNEALILDMQQNLAVAGATPQEDATTLAYTQLIESIENQQSAYDPALSEHLLALGRSLQSLARHEEAIDVFKRGVHIARINMGLYSPEQLTMLRGEISSHLALGDFIQVDERQRYLYRVERRALRHNSTASAQALLDQARWQKHAYIIGMDESDARFDRLYAMWQLNRMALEEVVNSEGDTSPALLAPLNGMLESQYLIAGHQGFDAVLAGNGYDDRHLAHNSLAYKQGRSVLEAIMQINSANNPHDLRQRARDLIQLGDWSWWFGDRKAALAHYQATYDAIDNTDNPEGLFDELFASPTPLPDLDGIRPLPAYNDNTEGALAIRFEVTDTGRVNDITRLQIPENEPEQVTVSSERLLRHLRRVRFRPTFQEGEAKPSTNIIWSFNPQNWQANTLVMTQ